MATLVLGAVGAAIGGGFGGAILGLSGAAIGGAIGSFIGNQVDQWALAQLMGSEHIEGTRLDALRVTSSTEGAVLPQVFGRMRLGGNIVWATDFLEEITTRKEKVSKYQKVTITEYSYSASFAVAICEGKIAGIGRIWADGELMDLTEVTWRWYPGDETQEPDALIAAAMGDETPAYRGTAYVVFENLALEAYGNRLPQLSFEVYRPLDDADAAEGLVRAVTMIPGTGEFVYATGVIKKGGGVTEDPTGFDVLGLGDDPGGAENENYQTGTPDMLVSLDQLEASMPAVESVSLVVSWFGDDLRAGSCTIKPEVEFEEKSTSTLWSILGLLRGDVPVVSATPGGDLAFGGTPADFTVVQAIQEMKSRGLRVTFYPFILMDVPEGNALPNPYSDNAATLGQPVYPWRGRITCSPAAGFTGTVDQTSTAAAQVAAFFGTATAADFAVSGTEVTWTGGEDWGYRRMILHYAHLCAAAGGVDSFLIGSELRGLTTIRSDATTYPAVAALIDLAHEARVILGPDVAIGYAADWSEFFGHQPGDGSGDVLFHLDPLWADPDIGFVGIDNYMPISDWRDGFDHLDAAAGWPAIYDRAYLQSNIEGGEGFEWYYASTSDRATQTRTPILDSYPVSRDIAVPREIDIPAIIGPTGVLTNSWHQVLGRDGYFHPDSGTSEGQFTAIEACARAALALTGTDPAAASAYSDRSRLLASALEETFYRRPYTSDTGVLLVPHWLCAARSSFDLQTAELAYAATFTSIGGGQLRAVIPPAAGGDVVLQVYSVRASDATLLWENPYSPVIGTAYTQSADPVTDETGTEVYIWGSTETEALIAYSYNRGDTLEVGQPYEAWPIWRRLEAGEVDCAGDAMRWAIKAFDAMDALHGGTGWAALADVTRASTVTAFAVDDGRWLIKPSLAIDPYSTAGLYTFASRPTTWTRSNGALRALVTGVGESQIGRGFEIEIAGTETITVKLGTTVATTDVQVFLDTAASYSAATRWVATLTLAGTGVQEFTLDLADFLRLSDNTPLSGSFTAYGFGVIDREDLPHAVSVLSARPTQSIDPAWTPWITPFTINVRSGEIIDWRGTPGSGYQSPDVWADIGGTDGPDGLLAHCQFLRAAQLAWQTDVGDLGPFAHAYVWDRFDAEEFGEAPGTWIYTWHDPNSKWAGYQYRPLEATARAILLIDGDAAYATGLAAALDVAGDYLAWLNATGWTSSLTGPPTDFPETGAETNYHEPHFAALILRACVTALQSTAFRADAGREADALALAARAWTYLESRFVTTGDLAGTWGGGAEEWFGFWQAEIVNTLAGMLLEGAAVTAELSIDSATVRARLVAAGDWLESASASTLGSEDGESWIFRYKGLHDWWTRYHHDRPGGTREDEPTAWQPQSKPIRFTEFGCPAIDRGTNQPNVFVDPKSSESFVPYFSRGWRDDSIQRAYLEAVTLYWGNEANNPVSAITGTPMIDLAECAVWTWDARPFPNFPGLSDVWADGANWRLGHWLTGRMGSVSLGPLVRTLCERAGLDAARVDVSGLWGSVEGYVIAALESPRASIAMLGRHFGFDAVETEGVIRFVMRGQARAATITLDDMVAGTGDRAEPMELTRGQETELAQALKWSLMRSDEDYDSAMVEARRTTAASARISSESFPIAVAPEEGERRVRRALTEAWVGRETASFRLPPSLLALDPSDVIGLTHDGRTRDYRLMTVADAEARTLSAVLQDRDAYDMPPGAARAVTLNTPVSYVPPAVAVLDLPQIFEGRDAWQPLVAAWASPWPGTMAVWRSPGSDGFAAFTTFNQRAQVGELAEDLAPGQPAIWYRGGMVVQLASGTLGSVNDLDLFGGANLLALEVGDGLWELIQAGDASLIDTRTYSLDRILRGQRGTEWLIGDTIPAGARVVMIDSDIASLPVLEADIGLAYNYRVGPASKAMAETSYAADTVTATGAGLKPFAPVFINAALEGGDIAITWIRRDRALVADTWTYGEVPMSEATEAYRIDILEDATEGAAVVRSIEVTTTAATYTAAQQAADFGAALAPGDSLTLVAYQISSTLGPGFPNRVTVML